MKDKDKDEILFYNNKEYEMQIDEGVVRLMRVWFIITAMLI